VVKTYIFLSLFSLPIINLNNSGEKSKKLIFNMLIFKYLLTAAPPTYSISFNPVLYKIEAHSFALIISNPLK
jgi:hypothetical protein